MSDRENRGSTDHQIDIEEALAGSPDMVATSTDPGPGLPPADATKGTEIDAIARLARLSILDYDRAKKGEAKALCVSVGALDKAVDAARKAARSTAKGEDKPDERHANILTQVEPWHEPVDGDLLLNAIARRIASHAVLPEGAATAIALWVLHAHAHGAASHSPNLGVLSPEKRCGKTVVLSLVADLVPCALPAANISPAAVFRSIEKWAPTLLIDEADAFLRDNEEMRGILNSGMNRASAFVIRCEGESFEPRPFSTWCPKLLAGIGNLPGTIMDRSIVITLRRKLADEKAERYRPQHVAAMHELRSMAARWASDHKRDLADADPDLPAGLNDRAGDCWRPLLAIADAAGGCWPERARKAAVKLSGAATENEADSAGVMLLNHVKILTASRDVIGSTELAELLCTREEWPWGEWKQGKAISPRGVARILDRYGIKPHRTKHGSEYRKLDFADAWTRYASASPTAIPDASATTVIDVENINGNRGLVRGSAVPTSAITPPVVADAKSAKKPMNIGRVALVADKNREDPKTKLNGTPVVHVNGSAGEFF